MYCWPALKPLDVLSVARRIQQLLGQKPAAPTAAHLHQRPRLAIRTAVEKERPLRADRRSLAR